MLCSMNEMSEAFQNLNLYPVPIEVSHDFTGYIADIEEPVEFQTPPLEKAKPKKKRRYVGWRKVRRRKPATRRLPKIENSVSMIKGKEIETGESSKPPEKEIGIDLKQKGIEVGESSKQPEELTFQDEIDRLLGNCEVISPIRTNLYPYPATVQFPLNITPAIPEPLIHTQPLGELEEWWTNDWQFQNIVNSPYSFLPQFDPEPLPNPPMSNENLAELRQFGEELIGTGNRIREMGEHLTWKYDEREHRY
ncbi:hypothetical protein HanRHA438_Chr15g0707911 [Helianthus annuus]|nr:hypothetical protein HanRHA438_Chr15g0707911 [Helianthus annuus]